MIRSFPPHPTPLPCLRRSGFAQAGPRGEGRPFIPPAELRGILAYFDKLGGRQVVPSQDSSIEDGFFLSRKALPLSIISSLSLFIWGAVTAFFPLYAINCGVANPGLFFTTIAIMLILGRAWGGKILDLYSKERIILPCLITYIISMVILAFSKTLPMFILVAVIWGIGNAFLLPSLVVYVLDRVGSSPGPAMGTFTAISDLGISLGPGASGHGHHHPYGQLSDNVPLLSSHGCHQSQLFLFFREKKRGDPLIMNISNGAPRPRP